MNQSTKFKAIDATKQIAIEILNQRRCDSFFNIFFSQVPKTNQIPTPARQVIMKSILIMSALLK